MITSIKQWFAPPVFEGDDKKNYRVKLLNVTINLSVCFLVLVVVGNLLDSSTPPRNFVIDFIFIGMFLFLRRLLFADRVKLVGYLILISAGILLTVSVSSEGTILAPATALFSLLVIMSGFIFNLRGIIAATIISSLLVAGLILARHAGILPPPNYTESTFQWFVFTFTFGLTGCLSYFYNQLTDQALERSRMEIRERQRIEMELRKLSLAVEQSPASIVITDLDGKIEYVNPRFTQITGYSFEKAIGKNPRILKSGKTPPETYRQLWDTVTAGKEWRGEFVNHKKDGSLYYESAIISPITDVNGVTTHYLAVKENITLRKQAERALRESEKKYESLIDGVVSVTMDGRFLECNENYRMMLGYRYDELFHLTYLDITPEKWHSYESSIVENEILKRGHSGIYEKEYIRKDGTIFPVELHTVLIRDEQGEAVGISAIVRDITERRQAEDALQKANEQLRAKMEKIEQLKEELREQAIHDPLTGLYNRRYLNEALMRELARAGRENNPLSVIISDIDHFKMINDTYGHLVGDKFLVEIARLMKKYARGSDIVCRYGGEEFLLVLPGTTLDSAAKRAEEIRQKCAEIILQHEGKDLKVTMSFGVAIYPDHGKEAEEIIVKADKALYRAKAQGRNRTVMFE